MERKIKSLLFYLFLVGLIYAAYFYLVWYEKFAISLNGYMHLMFWSAPLLFLLYQNVQKKEKDPLRVSGQKRIAMYPSIDKKFLSKNADGFILGKSNGNYVRIPLDKNNILHACVVGSPGSGKSAGPYLSTLISNFMQNPAPMTTFVIDIKPELARKSVEIEGNENVRVCNPTDRDSWGWDVYYSLDEDATDEEVIHVLDGISRALIVSNNDKNAFFTNNARTVFQGMMLYYYRKGKGFIDSIKEVVGNDVQTHINKILEDKDLCSKDSKIYSLLKKYTGKDSDAFQDIELSLHEHLNIFTEADVIWNLRDNPDMTCPTDLNDKISIFISIPENKLDHLADLLRLYVHQTLEEMEKRSEDSEPVAMILDEYPRLGKLEKIKSGLATLRSRRVSIWLAFQDLSQLESVYSREDARTIFNVCEIKVILSCNDSATIKQISEWAGDYREQKQSRTKGSKSSSTNTSQEYHKIISPSDVMTLREKKEVILFIEGHYYRPKQCRYYEDSILNKRNKKIMQINKKEG